MLRSSCVSSNGCFKGPQPYTEENFTNKLVVSSYHSAIMHDRDANYHRQNKSYRDLVKTQYNKTNQLEALIEMGDLEDDEYEEFVRNKRYKIT
jgi:hypothetical protein